MQKILIIEDNEKVASALNIRIKSAGYETVVASDALSGVSTAVKCRPDLVLVDINLPAGNGFEVVERIRAQLPANAPVIFITASKQPGLESRAVEMGASGFVEKPYNPVQLLTLVDNILHKSCQPPTVGAGADRPSVSSRLN